MEFKIVKSKHLSGANCEAKESEPKISYADADRLVACIARFGSIVCRGVSSDDDRSIVWYNLYKPERFDSSNPVIHVDMYTGENWLTTRPWAEVLVDDECRPRLKTKMKMCPYLTLTQCKKILPLADKARARRVAIDAETADAITRFVGAVNWLADFEIDLNMPIAFEHDETHCRKAAEIEMVAATIKAIKALNDSQMTGSVLTMSSLLTEKWLTDDEPDANLSAEGVRDSDVEVEIAATALRAIEEREYGLLGYTFNAISSALNKQSLTDEESDANLLAEGVWDAEVEVEFAAQRAATHSALLQG